MSTRTEIQQEEIELKRVILNDESYFKITNYDHMDPFFMSIVSDGNHWNFISSNGGLTAGRKNSNFALFPYYTDDKLTALAETTGSKTIFRIEKGGDWILWEPFSIRNLNNHQITRNLYKSEFGNKVLFEEINHDLALTFQYQWSSSSTFGFVRECFLTNTNKEEVSIQLLDGLQNILPYGVPEDLQAARSNLVNAYKRSELHEETGFGIFALSAIIVDKAEPSEALKANVAWSVGFDKPTYLLSDEQLNEFRAGASLVQENDMKGRQGAYFLSATLRLDAGQQKDWMLLGDVNKGPSEVVDLIEKVKESGEQLKAEILKDVDRGTEHLKQLVSAADGFQKTADDRSNGRHYSNALFNIMRGGIFDHHYDIEREDFVSYLFSANKEIAENHKDLLESLPSSFSYKDLNSRVETSQSSDLKRLSIEYLPLKFSRRHGDPSRPWNRFSINTRSEIDGSKILDYEGNWRDIFQNWEALAHSYPEFIDGMIFKFLNTSTFDGYNPYRVTKGGFDWEVVDENDPWSYIGYWGDHQIIYLLKFLEFTRDYYPDELTSYFDQDLFVYANVPYKIKSYREILETPKDSITFDHQLDSEIRARRDQLGADGALLEDADGKIYKVNFIEKILATSLAKLSNFIPEAGIWLNTQRPEWNDANNALVGNGVSMVTLYYLHRFFQFFQEILSEQDESKNYPISIELLNFFKEVSNTLQTHKTSLRESMSDQLRKSILDGLGAAGTTYRNQIYHHSFSGEKQDVENSELLTFIDVVLEFLQHSIRANEREDKMYHAYNLMTLENENEISISYLDEMLEGQVAVLSSGFLDADHCVNVLDAMKGSKLFREDQYSYMLYPNKELPGFLEKNIIPNERVNSSDLFNKLLEDGNQEILNKDVKGQYHFNGNFNNADSLKKALKELPGSYDKLVEAEEDLVLRIFEEVFNHKAFTGRSGTFFGYEGLGSIYWHMVSKLRLAIKECFYQALETNASEEILGRLIEHYYEVTAGIGAHKSPELYGAFPTDPYSHTPKHKGAQQPGMTGQVKEDILSRMGELGINVENGRIQIRPGLLKSAEFLDEPASFSYLDINDNFQKIELQKKQLAFSICQVPFIYEISNEEKIKITYFNGSTTDLDGLLMDTQSSQHIFSRTAEIKTIRVYIPQHKLI